MGKLLITAESLDLLRGLTVRMLLDTTRYYVLSFVLLVSRLSIEL